MNDFILVIFIFNKYILRGYLFLLVVIFNKKYVILFLIYFLEILIILWKYIFYDVFNFFVLVLGFFLEFEFFCCFLTGLFLGIVFCGG